MFRSILVVLIIAACGMTLAIAGGEWDKPWQSHGRLTQVLDFPGAVGRCNPGDPLARIQGAGNASYMGVVNIEQTHCQNLTSGQFYNGEFLGIGVDGSTYFGTYGGQSVPTINCPDISTGQCVFRALGEWQLTGGTGRYSTVLGGSGPARGTLNTMTGMVSLFMQGNIVSDGALKGEF